MNPKYEYGRRFEYRVKDLLKKAGFTVMRCAGSKPYDLVGIKDGYCFLVECKTSEKGRNSLIRKLYKESNVINTAILLVQNTSTAIQSFYIKADQTEQDVKVINEIITVMNVEIWD